MLSILLRTTKDCAQDDSLGKLDIKGVDFLGADVADKDRSAIRGEATPGSNGGKVAPEVFQADHDFMLEKDVSPEGQAKIEQIFKNSEPTFMLGPGYLRNPIIDLAYQGEVKVSPDNILNGHMLVSADTLDKVRSSWRPP